VIFHTDEERDPDHGDPMVWVENGPSTLGLREVSNVILSNHVHGETCRLSMAGLDEAGNLGPLSDAHLLTLPQVSILHGAARNAGGVDFTINERPGHTYDLIAADASGFGSISTNQWTLIATGMTDTLVDSNSISGNLMRFYRVAPQNAWKPGALNRSASEEVYVSREVRVYPGQNWVSLPGVVDTCSVAQIFGVDLPSGFTPGASTRISWYERTSGEVATNQIWLASGSPNAWVYSHPPALSGQSANDRPVALQQGVILESPSSASFLFVGRVPTNAQEQVIMASAASPNFNLVGFRLPRHMHPSEMGLVGAGFQGGGNAFDSDWLVKFDKTSQTVRSVFYRTTDSTWRFTTFPFPTVPAGYFGPDDALLISTRKSITPWTWTNALPYAVPTRFMNP
jgi:hypothetical protein